MAIRDLVVAYDGNEASEKALEFALRMATKYGAMVTGLNVTMPERFEGHVRRWMTSDTTDAIKKARLDAISEIEAKFRKHVAASEFTGETGWIVEEGPADLTIARTARFFDVLIMGQFLTAFSSDRRTVDPPTLLLRAGKPVIIVPKDYTVRPFKEHAAIAWDGSRYAARALTDAMQILETKTSLDVLTVKGDAHAEEMAKMPGLDIIIHLQRHGIDANLVELERQSGSIGGIGGALLSHCGATDPDVLVMGAFGRGTFGQTYFGGVSRTILQHQNVPVLISH
ncbi:MAG: universal stress protein [Pseudomonadota bacterium]